MKSTGLIVATVILSILGLAVAALLLLPLFGIDIQSLFDKSSGSQNSTTKQSDKNSDVEPSDTTDGSSNDAFSDNNLNQQIDDLVDIPDVVPVTDVPNPPENPNEPAQIEDVDLPDTITVNSIQRVSTGADEQSVFKGTYRKIDANDSESAPWLTTSTWATYGVIQYMWKNGSGESYIALYDGGESFGLQFAFINDSGTKVFRSNEAINSYDIADYSGKWGTTKFPSYYTVSVESDTHMIA